MAQPAANRVAAANSAPKPTLMVFIVYIYLRFVSGIRPKPGKGQPYPPNPSALGKACAGGLGPPAGQRANRRSAARVGNTVLEPRVTWRTGFEDWRETDPGRESRGVDPHGHAPRPFAGGVDGIRELVTAERLRPEGTGNLGGPVASAEILRAQDAQISRVACRRKRGTIGALVDPGEQAESVVRVSAASGSSQSEVSRFSSAAAVTLARTGTVAGTGIGFEGVEGFSTQHLRWQQAVAFLNRLPQQVIDILAILDPPPTPHSRAFPSPTPPLPGSKSICTPEAPAVRNKNYINDRRAQSLKPLVNYLSLNPADLQVAQAFESGPKDVVRAAPYAVTRIVMQWPTNSMFYNTPSARSGDPATDGRYIFHCHILDHEDSDMMRPLQVKPPWQFTHTAFPTDTVDLDGDPQFQLAYPYRLNQKYRVEATTDLRTPNWRVIPGTGAVLDNPKSRFLLTLPAKGDLEFYRVSPVLPQP